jgi:VCBS repeat-containing protein
MPLYGRRCPIRHLQPFRRSIAAICCLTLLPLSSASGAGRHRSVSPPTAQLTANPDAYAAGQGKALAVVAAKGVLVNDRDPQGKPLIALLAANPRHGTLTFNADGSFTYTNDGTGAASDSFTYQASNGTALSNIATVTITLGGADAITAAADSYSLPHGGNITVAAPGVLANDLDPNGAPLTASAAALPAHGSLTLNPNGSFTYAHDGTNTTSDSFSYRASDGTLPAATGAATLTIGTDTAPVVASQTYTTTQNTPLTVAAPGVLTGAVDPDSPAITALLQTPASHGAVSLNPNGSFVYTPATGYAGADSFTYRGSDGIVTSANAGTAAITVSAIPRPSAADDRYVATTPTLTIAAPGILGNDTINGAPIISFGINGNDQNGIGHPAVTARNGQITLNADGSFVYNAPSATFAGDDTFRYVISNPSGTSTASVTITVALVNTKCPAASIGPSTLPVGAAGAIYPAVSFTMTGGAGPVVWTSGVLPAGMSFSNAGVLTGTAASVGSYNITEMATDASACVAVTTLILTVGCPAVAISATNLAAATDSVAYPPVVLSAFGGTAPFAWSVSSGTLPAGMTLSSAGVLAGTPSQIASFLFVVKATDANGCFGTSDLAIVVKPRCPAITITPTTLPDATLGVVYAATSFSQSGGMEPVTWSSGVLPPGMNLSADGVLSGTATAFGVFNIAVTARDANSCTASVLARITISNGCTGMTITTPSLAAGTADTPYVRTTFQTSGSVGTVTWRVTLGELPVGMTFSPAGVLEGTPTQPGTFAATIEATDTRGCRSTAAIQLTIDPKCVGIIISGTPPHGKLGELYPAFTFSQTGGTPTVTWSSGALPSGMRFSTSGVLSGTPLGTGTFSLVLQVTDAIGCIGTATIKFVVGCPAIVVTASQTIGRSNLPTMDVDVPYGPISFTRTGGVAPFVWSIGSGTLPPGVTFSSDGILSGTPKSAGSSTITFKVTDVAGCVGAGTYSVTSTCPANAVNNPGVTSATVNSSFSQTFTLSNATTGTFSTSSILPDGLTFNNGVLSGTPTETGTFPIIVTFTDGTCSYTNNQGYSLSIGCDSVSVSANPALQRSVSSGFIVFSAFDVLTGRGLGFSASGSNGSTTFTASGLPSGLTLQSNGLLAGQVLGLGGSVTVHVIDENGCSGSTVYPVLVVF